MSSPLCWSTLQSALLDGRPTCCPIGNMALHVQSRQVLPYQAKFSMNGTAHCRMLTGSGVMMFWKPLILSSRLPAPTASGSCSPLPTTGSTLVRRISECLAVDRGDPACSAIEKKKPSNAGD